MGGISTRYRTVTYETFLQWLSIDVTSTELLLSSSADSFELTVEIIADIEP